MNTNPRFVLVSLSVGVALTLAPSAASASLVEAGSDVVEAVPISAPIEDVPAFGDGPVDAPSDGPTVDGPVDQPTVDAPIEAQTGGPVDAPVLVDDAETISAPVDDDGIPAGAIGGGVVIVGAAVAGSAALRRARARNRLSAGV